MQGSSRNPVVIFSLSLLLFLAASCSQSRILITVVPAQDNTTISPNLPNLASSTRTPTPSPQGEASPLQPNANSILRWVDLSDFVFLPAGEFIMGEDSSTSSDHSPAHAVYLDGFWIQKNEVTNQQYAQCVNDGACSPPDLESSESNRVLDPYQGDNPVVGVNWFQAQEYCMYIDARLPSEAEWEKAAGEINLNKNSFEWVNDWYAEAYYSSSPAEKPEGPQTGTFRVYRGLMGDSEQTNEKMRFSLAPEKNNSTLGFRCVLVIDPTEEPHVNIAQPCQVVANNYQLQEQPTNTPYPCALASLSSSCQYEGSNAVVDILIEQTTCQNSFYHSFSVNDLSLTCSVSRSSDGTNNYQCRNSSAVPGSKVELSYCDAIIPRTVVKTCPNGYTFNSTTSYCELEKLMLNNEECPQGYLEIPLKGCLPVYDENAGGCPIGYYSVTYSASSVCLPLDECLLSTTSESCVNPACSTGDIYDAQNGCCSSTDQSNQHCAQGYFYNADQNVCLNREMYPYECHTEEMELAYCPLLATRTPQPSITPTEIEVVTTPTCGWIWNPATSGWDPTCP